MTSNKVPLLGKFNFSKQLSCLSPIDKIPSQKSYTSIIFLTGNKRKCNAVTKVVNQFPYPNTHIHEFPTSQETMHYRHAINSPNRFTDSLWHHSESVIHYTSLKALYEACKRCLKNVLFNTKKRSFSWLLRRSLGHERTS